MGQRITLLPGQRFGKLVVIKFCGTKPNGSGTLGLHECVCDCGRRVVRATTDLIRGKRSNCGIGKCNPVWRGGYKNIGSEAWATKKLGSLKAQSRRGGYAQPYESAQRVIELWEMCNGVCSCCTAKSDVPLHLDHCHQTGRLRGFICKTCNTCIGYTNDSAFRLVCMASWVASRPA